MNNTDPIRFSRKSDQRPLKLWRPDFEFEANWFVVELRWEGEGILATENSIRRNLLTSALSLLRSPDVKFNRLSHDQMFLSIDSPDALISLRVSSNYIVIEVQVIENAAAAVRFCENVDGNCHSGKNRVRVMPDGEVGKFYQLDSGYIFSRVVERWISPCQTITLSDHPVYGRALVLNREIQIGERDEILFSGTMVSHAFCADTKRVLILGGGDCGVLREVLVRPVERVVMVEFDKEVLRFCEKHFPSIVGGALDDARAELRFEDAFKYLADCQERFDVVLADLPDTPIGDLTLDDQIKLMSDVLTENGTLGTHAEFNNFEGSYEAEPIIAAISRRFNSVEVTSKVIPSYQDQKWLFVKASGIRSLEQVE
jgi:spermidine synthase